MLMSVIDATRVAGFRRLLVGLNSTSPPYWGSFRDYGRRDQIGLKSNAEDYIKKVVAVFRELARVLTDDGTIWLVLGDTYISTGGNSET